ncbi:MAG: hypothetical protein A2381_10450 [Bdellovibrionales bacterium RIFOXYB1_FULL_37_110]|nr:MAG: hypothetical protein A2417_05670 [Bdellovibrionales bacterium RIFOXYC1_FULL_37_79]OFZ61183.1 MAG: hypothetical protein A2381_10450 [Bdellovibrionales bacterium RIFOXYB1_FULL_37_110]OFZ65511.1 MAG: hypothetical protein A2577_01870 [Bdellovibrionales bacterium RIFOXYD1_FULL_36_51]
MKSAIIIMTLLSFTIWDVCGSTTLKIPVYANDGEENYISASDLNKQLIKVGIKPLPLYLEISSNDQNSYKKFEQLDREVSHAMKSLGHEYGELRDEIIPNSDMQGTCYLGDGGEEVVDLVFSLADHFYTDQMNLWGWKHRDEMNIESEEPETTLKFLNENSAIWKNWNSEDDAVLMVLAYSDDGDDMNESIIPKCE